MNFAALRQYKQTSRSLFDNDQPEFLYHGE
jgi:hypothetical protein